MYRVYLILSIRHCNGCVKYEFNELSLHMNCKTIPSENVLTTYITKLGILVINFTVSNTVVFIWYKCRYMKYLPKYSNVTKYFDNALLLIIK